MSRHSPWPRGRRLLMLHQSAELYGSDRMLLEVARWVRDGGGEPVVLLPASGLLTELLHGERIEVHVLDEAQLLKVRRSQFTPHGIAQALTSLPGSVRAIDACIGDRHIDAVYSSTLATLGGVAWSSARRRPHLWHLHERVDSPAFAGWLFARLVERSADHVICNSRSTRQWLLHHAVGLDRRTSVVCNGVKAVDDARQPAGNGATVIGLVGRIHPQKGQALAVDALERLHREGDRHTRLVIAGDTVPGQDEVRETLRTRIAASPIAARVELLGFIADPTPVYLGSDIVCVPSIGAEGFGLVAAEAMAAARPVVAADQGGLREIVVHEVTGLRHRPGDAADLARALATLIADRPRRLAMGAAAQARHAARFGVDTMRAGLGAAFDRLPAA